MNGKPGAANEFMQEQFASFRSSLDELRRILDRAQMGPASSDPRVASFKDGIFCLELALMFYEEANRAVQAEAWFAASSIASSALEAVLLSKCFFEEDRIRKLPKFAQLKKNHKGDFGQFARALDLGKLLEIAAEVSWFPDSAGLPRIMTSYLSSHLDEAALSDLILQFQGIADVGRACADHVRKYRNLLHPAVCLKEGQQPSREGAITATFLFMIAFVSLARTSQG